MKILEFNSIGGASGDMILAALIDLGADEKVLQARLNSLGIEPFRLDVRRSVFDGLRGVQVRVRIGAEATAPEVAVSSAHDHAHNHDHKHDHDHEHAQPHN
ncbi:MAG: nickel insertion protein, partial [Kiritimatiellia bacterium]